MKLKSITAVLCVAFATAAAAAPIEVGYTYDWNKTSDSGTAGDNKATEFDGNSANNFVLNDGAVSPSGVVGWNAGQNGLIIQNFDPTVTINLGSVINLDSVVLRYNVHYDAGVQDPDSVSIIIDGGTPIVFSSFPNTSANTTQRVVPINLTGNSGQIIALTVTSDVEWMPFSEIDVNAVPAAVPEPGTLTLLGLGGVLFVRRRGRRIS